MNPLKHVAIIMDGNGRWGLKKNKSRNFGHKQGLKTVEMIIKVSLEKKIDFLTLFVFSTENWKRPKKEIQFLFNLLENFLKKKISILNKQKIRLKIIGKKKFPIKIKKLLISSEKITKKNSNMQLNLALNYGFKTELIDAVKKIRNKGLKITEQNLKQNLYTKNIPDPDLLIRTGNTNRLSNFLLWQLAYSEIFFERKLWPDFKKDDYLKILDKYQKIKRNFGNI